MKRNTREEDARITAAAKSDPDNPPLTVEQLARMRPASETHATVVERYRRTRGRQIAATKKQVTLRLDQDIVDHYRKAGKGWQTRINDDLRSLLEKIAAPTLQAHQASIRFPPPANSTISPIIAFNRKSFGV